MKYYPWKISGSSHPERSRKKIPKNIPHKFTRKNYCERNFFVKVAGLHNFPTKVQKHSILAVFQRNWRHFSKRLFYRTHKNGCFCISRKINPPPPLYTLLGNASEALAQGRLGVLKNFAKFTKNHLCVTF